MLNYSFNLVHTVLLQSGIKRAVVIKLNYRLIKTHYCPYIYHCKTLVRLPHGLYRDPTVHEHTVEPRGRLTGVGDGEAVGRLNVVHVRHQVERGFWGVRAGVVQEDRQAKGGVLLISVSDEQTTWTEGGGQGSDEHRRIIHNLTTVQLFRDMKNSMDLFSFSLLFIL